MIAFLEPFLAILRKVPVWVYVLVAALVVILYYKHEVVEWRNKYTLLAAQNANAKVAQLQADALVSNKRIEDLSKEATDAKARADLLAINNAALASTNVRVSGQLAAVKRRFTEAGDTPTPQQFQAARTAVGVLADMLAERQRTSAARSGYADAVASAAAGCERQYESVRTSGGNPSTTPSP